MKIPTVDYCIVGAGVIGLAIAQQLASPDNNTVILEKNAGIGFETSSRSSEVIHSGIYYPKNWLKTSLCVSGRDFLYAFCQQYNVPYRRVGKFVVAVRQQQIRDLEKLYENAIANSVDDVVLFSKDQVKCLEPNISCAAALFAPASGIVDSHQFMLALLAKAERQSAILSLNTVVDQIEQLNQGFYISCNTQNESYKILTKNLIIAAGLHQTLLLKKFIGLEKKFNLPIYFVKGDYFQLKGKNPFNHLIYPLPVANLKGLGVHATFDLNGRVRFGPDAEYVTDIKYEITSNKVRAFHKVIQPYFPRLQITDLAPDYSGIRPKLSSPTEPAKDFSILTAKQHCIPGLVILSGIESPGLTASLAIAKYVQEKLI